MNELLEFKGFKAIEARQIMESDTIDGLASEMGKDYVKSLISDGRAVRTVAEFGKLIGDEEAINLLTDEEVGNNPSGKENIAVLVTREDGEDLVDNVYFFIAPGFRTQEEIKTFRGYLAGKYGRQPGSIFPDSSLKMLAELQPKYLSELEGKPQFPRDGERVETFGNELCDFFKPGFNMDDLSSSVF